MTICHGGHLQSCECKCLKWVTNSNWTEYMFQLGNNPWGCGDVACWPEPELGMKWEVSIVGCDIINEWLSGAVVARTWLDQDCAAFKETICFICGKNEQKCEWSQFDWVMHNFPEWVLQRRIWLGCFTKSLQHMEWWEDNWDEQQVIEVARCEMIW